MKTIMNFSQFQYGNFESNAMGNHDEDDVIFTYSTDIIISTIYVLLTLVNFIGNTTMIFLIIRRRQLHTTVNYLLLNLSLSDIVGGIGIYPYVFVTNISSIKENQLNLTVVCSLTQGLSIFFLAAGVSLITLCAVSLYRYCIIRFPLRALWTRSKRTVEIIITLVWILSIASIFPAAVSYRYSPEHNICERDWRNIDGNTYRCIIMVVSIILPSAFMFLCYFALRHARRKISRRCVSANSSRIKMVKRSERLIAFLIANFVICWTPFLVYWGIRTFTSLFPQTYDGLRCTLKWIRVTVIFAVVNGAVDPFLFAASSKEIRKQAKKLLFRVVRAGPSSTTVIRIHRIKHINTV